ncbi:MAG: hypothetical protein LJE84_12910 [Gammaproteobacteria bacterium]|jgi:hypothetical protein|nr:hypothetical protein [Gammaproteobacteria bacterium]
MTRHDPDPGYLGWELFAEVGDEMEDLVRTLDLFGEISAAEAEWHAARRGLAEARQTGLGLAAARRRVDVVSVELVRLRLVRAQLQRR